jgi:hypothetical protein
MNKEFIPYEQALALKQLGFNEPCLGAFIGKELKIFSFSNDLKGYTNDANLIIGAATYQQAFRFFREKYDLHRHICYFSDTNVWHVDIYKTKNNGLMNHPMELTNYTTYEEAELACLKKLIEIVKNK